MTAMDGGPRLDDGSSAMNPVLERPEAGRRPRSLEEIFPLRGGADRARQMKESWLTFSSDMTGAVRKALGPGKSPPEIAYAIGEIVHNYFRTRGIVLASFELRRLVAELLAHQPAHRTGGRPLVRFAEDPSSRPTAWTGSEIESGARAVPEAAFEAPPSRLVAVVPREDELALVAAVATEVRARLAGDPFGLARPIVVDAIAAVLAARADIEPGQHDRLARLALSELCGLGPIDRLWADPSVRAVFVNGPAWIQVERNGVVEPSVERFRDRVHLEDIAGRLAPRPAVGATTVNLRDGSEGVVLFPPAAPDGPVIALRRGEPGDATFERLIAGGCLDRPMADLLRIASRSRLSVLVVGPARAGKTALLAAMARDLGDARLVTVAPHRAFRWPSASKIELVASAEAPFAELLAAGARLRPDLLVADSLTAPDMRALCELLRRGMCAVGAAAEPTAMAGVPPGTADLVVRLGPAGDGLFLVASMEDARGAQIFVHHPRGGFHRRMTSPSFAAAVQAAGYREALASVLR